MKHWFCLSGSIHRTGVNTIESNWAWSSTKPVRCSLSSILTASTPLPRSTSFAIDDTIDPAETRHWLASLLAAQRPAPPREGKKRPMVDAW